jgi:flagellar motor switch protein FliN
MAENSENQDQEGLSGSASLPDSDANQNDLLGQDEIERLLAESLGANTASSKAEPPPTAQTATEDPAANRTAATPSRPTAAETIASGDLEYLFNQAERALRSIETPSEEGLPPGVEPFMLEPFGGAPASSEMATIDVIRDVELNVRIELGRTQLQIEDVLKLHRGSVVPLDKLAGDPVDIYVNDRLVARGEILVLNDNFCVRVTELVAERAIA